MDTLCARLLCEDPGASGMGRESSCNGRPSRRNISSSSKGGASCMPAAWSSSFAQNSGRSSAPAMNLCILSSSERTLRPKRQHSVAMPV
eukprot:1136513-Pleurochrysis_carterae.AAC.3